MAGIDAHELKEQWLDVALHEAKIDRARWHPVAGVEENRHTIGDVYDYYARLFVHNRFLLWAGMASMIGPAFYAAFLDLGFFPDKARRLASTVLGWTSRGASRQAAGDLGFYETLFLTMQKKIFEDQATMHEAYLKGGVPEIERFYRANIIDLATLGAWQQIDQGKRKGTREPLESACRILLWREQREIIGHMYDRMMHYHGPEGWVFTYAMTYAGAPSLPGARSASQAYPFILTPPVLRRPSLTTPLAEGNIARFADRWRLIEHDTLPTYLALVREDEAEAIAEAQMPILERAVRYRLRARALALMFTASRWRLGFGSGTAVTPDGKQTRALSGEHVCLDLESLPTPDALGIASPKRTRVWMRTRRRPLKVQVRLPGGQVYKAEADLVAATSFALDGQRNHVVVSLPRTHLTETEDLLEGYASEWRIDVGELVEWSKHAERVGSSSDRAHGSHVLTPAAVGSVQLEFEVAHHVGEKEFHISALFSW